MQRYILSRIIQSILLLVGVVVLVFFMVRLTGDPARLMVPRDATAEQVEAFREAMGFNRPLITQFFDFFLGVFRGDLGDSLNFRQPTLELIMERLPGTIQLAVTAMSLAIIVAIPLGISGGTNPGSLVDSVGRSVGLLGQVIPNFWLALILILIFGVRLRWFPTFGRDSLSSVVLPAVALGLATMGQLVRMTRSAVLEIRNEDYIRTARSKGLTSAAIAARHVFRNASIALISVIGVSFTYLLGGSVYIETIFSWPGLGNLLDQAIRARDFPLVQAIAIFIAGFAILMGLVTDLMYGLVDPRIRYGR
jgi:ABC-type dipeptide/oligopeptide/nickel transport system permease component